MRRLKGTVITPSPHRRHRVPSKGAADYVSKRTPRGLPSHSIGDSEVHYVLVLIAQ
jgi:hypothetical protein